MKKEDFELSEASSAKKAHEYNMDVAQREIDRRDAEGEDMTGAKIDSKTYKIIKPKRVKEEVEQIDEISKKAKKQYIDKAVHDLTTRAYKHGFKTAGPYKRHDSEIAAAERNIKNRQVGIHRATQEEVELEEGGMPSSVIRSKQKYAAMTNQEFADLHGHKTEEQLRQMAWSHGYGKMSPHYWNRVQKAKAPQMKEEVDLDEAVPYTLGGRPDKSNVYKVHRQDWKGNWSHNSGDTYHSLDDAKTVANNMKKGAGSTVKTKITKHARTKLAGPKGVLPEEVEQLEEAQNLIPLISQLKALLSWLVSSGAIRKFAKEEADVVGMLELLEYRTKGAVGKKNRPAASKESGESHSETGETKKQEHDEDMPDAYARASRDGRHVIPELSDAAQDKEGGTMQSSNGERPVSQKVAQLFHDHLMKMKPAERAEHSAHIFNGKVPNVKTLNHIKTARLISQMGSEKKIGSDEGVKRGRGRPKKVQ
jgi:hypothetical protein